MRKILVISLAVLLVFTLAACAGIEALDLPPMPSVEPATGLKTDAEDIVQQPEETEPPQTPGTELPEPEPVDLGAQVIVNIENRTEVFSAPDNERQRILTFGYDTAMVHIEGNEYASSAINHALAVEDELFYTGTGVGDGINGMLEQATDNYSIAVQTGEDMNLELSSVRTVTVSRADSRVVSLVYLTNNYTGGEHGYYFKRAQVFDAESGDALTLSQLSADTDAFSAFLIEQMTEQARGEDSKVDLVEAEDLPEALTALLRNGSWYLDENGLVIFSDIYEISSYASGIVYFTIPYEQLRPYLNENLFPIRGQADGGISVAYTADARTGGNDPEAVSIVDKVTVQPDGDDLLLTVSGTIYDVEIATVHYIDDGIGFYEVAEHWACSYLHESAIQLVTVVPDGMPNLMIRFSTADGTAHKLLLSQSGEDGGLMLTDTDIVAVG